MKGQNVGYIRVSSILQYTEPQLDGIELDEVFTEKVSAKDAKRPQLQACIKYVRMGDTLHVHSIDRLARNLKDLQVTVEELTNRGVKILFHKENLLFSGDANPMQMLMLQMIGAFAEFERALIKERQMEGIQAAKAKGKHLGRPKTITDETISQLLVDISEGMPKSQAAQKYGISRTKLYQILHQQS
jgi:DNA invertase Pin-like site-specific DNA recombinase